jgi:hypothetical protein
MVVVVVALLASCSLRSIDERRYTYDDVKPLFERQRIDNREDENYKKFTTDWLLHNNSHGIDEKNNCYALGIPTENLILILNDAGVVQHVVTENQTEKAQCFVEVFRGEKYPKPPFSPFYVHLSMETRLSGQDKRDLLTGTWGWNNEQCKNNPISISFSSDGSRMYHETPEGMYTKSEDYKRKRATYVIYDEGPQTFKTSLIGEDRVDAEGDPVKWDLVIQSYDSFCWRRSDWGEGTCTEELQRC